MKAVAASPSLVILSGSFPPRVCGIADYSSHLAASLRERGATGTVVWTGERETEPQPGIVAPVVTGWDVAGVRRLVHDLAIARPALVHLQYERSIYNGHPALPLLLPILLRRARLPLVTTFHALDGPAIYGKAHRLALLPLFYGSRDLVVCTQRQVSALRRLGRLGGNVARRTTLIPVGSVIPVLHTRPEMRQPGPLRLLYFGFVWRGRHIETLIEALAAVRRTPAGTGTTLEIVGGLRDESYRAEVDALARERKVADGVRFRGALSAPDVSLALANADLVLLPFATGVSTGRTTLMAALEHGAPIVTFGVDSNLSPLFRDGVNMNLVSADDSTGYVERVVSLANDDEQRKRLAEGARELASSFSWQAIADKTLALPAYRAAMGV